jgi:membrane fusion protein, heavy metal efflux system
VMGRVTSLTAVEGQDVRSGQPLATILSTGLSEAQLDFLKALSQKLVAQRAVDRAQVLLQADVIGSAELQRREAELAEAGATLDASRDRLLQLGMPAEAIEELRKTRTMNSISRIVANMDGTVMERKVTPGQMVQPADTIYEIADLSNVWMVADVPEANAGNLRVGQAVEASIAALPNVVISGKLSFVSATVNRETRTVMVRMNVPNSQKRLKPAMLATMELKEHTERKPVVPVSAVVREGNDDCVFVRRDENLFVLRPVKLGAEYGGRRVLLEGVHEGERIVVDGAFHLNNERRRRAVRGSEES